MLGALTYHAITAMTRERLAAIEQRLLAKIRSQSNVSPLERQVYFLAKTAREGLSLAPHLPSEHTLPSFARQLSLQAVFGSVALSFTDFCVSSGVGQRWLGETLRAGTPDPNRQRVLARSTDFVLELSERGVALINASTVANKPAELAKLRATLLGYTCHIAADVVSAPLLDAAVARLGDGTVPKQTEAQVAAAIERAAAELLRRDLEQAELTTRGSLYTDWWLRPEDVPAKFFDAFKESLEAVYGPGALPELRPQGESSISPQVSPSFMRDFRAASPPALSPRLLEDGYASFRTALEARYFTFPQWVAATAVIFLPPIAAYPLCVAMPHTRALFKNDELVDGAAVDKDVGWFGLVMAPLAMSALAPAALSIFVAALTDYGVNLQTVLGWIAAGLELLAAIVFLATIGKAVEPWQRWLLLFIGPFVLLLAHAIFVLTTRPDSDPSLLLALGSLLPCLIVVLYLVFHLVWHLSQDLGMNGWLKVGDDGQREEWKNAGFIVGWVLWGALMLAGWLVLAHFLERSGPAASPDPEVARRKHFLRLFGHATLIGDPALGGFPSDRSAPTLAQSYFPSDARPLLKMWWEGTGELWLRSDRHSLVFSTSEDGTGNPQTILAPTAPITASEYARFVSAAVKEGTLFNGRLKVELADGEDFDYELPPGPLFSDGADDKSTVAEHDAAAARFVRLATSAGSATVLRHGPRVQLAGFHGTAGDVEVDQDRLSVGANARDHDADAGTVARTSTFRVYRGAGFDTLFAPGDRVRLEPPAPAAAEERTVLRVISATELLVDAPFAALASTTSALPCKRVGRLSREGFHYAPAASGGRAGDSLMERAADLGALLCMGMASRLLTGAERRAVSTGPDVDRRPAVNAVHQVFRNWNLNHRRVNEWRMLIGGGANSEKSGMAAAVDPLQGSAPPDWLSPTPNGESLANRLGWVPLLQRWLAVAGQPGVDSLSTTTTASGAPTPRALSEGVAFLLDLPLTV